jgi:polyisoprenoid-binding protein YceI
MNKLALAATALLVPAALAASALPLSFASGSRVWVSGTSTTRSWRCESTQVEGTVQAGSSLASLGRVAGARVSIPVAALDCRNGTMNGHMRKALKAAEAPALSFQATDVTVHGTTAQLAGNLSMAGQTHPVTMTATVAEEGGAIRVRGTKEVDMREWGVRPPSLMLGTMRVGPRATVGFDVMLKP